MLSKNGETFALGRGKVPESIQCKSIVNLVDPGRNIIPVPDRGVTLLIFPKRYEVGTMGSNSAHERLCDYPWTQSDVKLGRMRWSCLCHWS